MQDTVISHFLNLTVMFIILLSIMETHSFAMEQCFQGQIRSVLAFLAYFNRVIL